MIVNDRITALYPVPGNQSGDGGLCDEIEKEALDQLMCLSSERRQQPLLKNS